MRVLHVSHTGTVSGGEHSLLTLLAAMPEELELGVACPDGALSAAVREIGLPVHRIPGMSASFRLHPVQTARAAGEIAAAAVAVRRVADREGATVLHANSVRAGLITALAGMGGAPPAAVHVRDVLPPGAAARAVKRTVRKRAAALIAISHYVQREFGAPMTVVDNPVDRRRFDAEQHDAQACRRMLGVDDERPLLGIIGQITSWKGHDTAVRALSLVRERHAGPRLAVVGEIKFSAAGTRLDNRAFLRQLHDLVAELRLTDDVLFLGERRDIPQILRALDVLLVPSTAEPFGRTVAEAMTMATPVVATSVGGPPELLEDGVSGLLAAPGDPEAWAAAIDRLLSDPGAAREMAQRARASAWERFDTDRHARAMVAIFESVAGS